MQLVNARTVISLQNNSKNLQEKQLVVPGDTTKYVVLFPNEANPRRIYVDATTTAQSLASTYDCCNTEKAIEHAILGGSTVILTSSVGLDGVNERKKYTNKIIEEIENHVSGTDNLTLTFLYAALTDYNIIDFHKNESIPNEKIKSFNDLHSICKDWAEIQDLFNKDTPLPFILSIRFEYDGDISGPGELNIVDLGTPIWDPSVNISSIADGPIEKSISDFLEKQIIQSLNFAENIRKIRTVPTINLTDRRVFSFQNSLKIGLMHKFELSKENGLLQEKINNIEKDLDDLQHAWADEKRTIEDEIGNLQKQKSDLQTQITLTESEKEDLKLQHVLDIEKKNTETLLIAESVEKLKIELVNKEKINTGLTQDILEMSQKYESSVKSQKKIVNYLRISEERVDELTKQLNESDKPHDDYELSYEKERLKRDKEGLERQISSLKSFLEQANVREEELRLYNENIFKQLSQEKSTTHKLISKLQNKSMSPNDLYLSENIPNSDLTTAINKVINKNSNIIKKPNEKNRISSNNLDIDSYIPSPKLSEVVIYSATKANKNNIAQEISPRISSIDREDKIKKMNKNIKKLNNNKVISDETEQTLNDSDFTINKKVNDKTVQSTTLKTTKNSRNAKKSFDNYIGTEIKKTLSSSKIDNVDSTRVTKSKSTKSKSMKPKKVTISKSKQINKDENNVIDVSEDSAVMKTRSKRQCASNISYFQSPIPSLVPKTNKALYTTSNATNATNDADYSSTGSNSDESLNFENIIIPKSSYLAKNSVAKKPKSKISQMAERIRSRSKNKILNEETDKDLSTTPEPKNKKKRKISIGKNINTLTIGTKANGSELDNNAQSKIKSFSLHGFKLPALKLPNIK
ncbi:hypothetical protein BB561_003831 [Smittium simulii]|uniref:Uncharacterized protein n=1 Tax=Smittium simulii TaxID=133385 RepID=A0A2T9YJ99_9FUNG|nr:hypothetical protein BB561_003831 [Smittium simulii]